MQMLIRRRSIADQYTESNNTVDQMSEIWRFWVPRGIVLQLDPTRPAQITLAFAESVTPSGTGSQVLATTYSVARVLDPSGGYTDGDYQGVYLTADGTKRTISAVADHVDGGTPSITISDATAAAHQVCYVPKTAGRIVLKIEKPLGMGSAAYPILDTDANKLHTMNQGRFFKLSGPCPIPEDYALVLYVNGAWANAFVSGTTLGSISLPFANIEIPALQKNIWDFGADLKQQVDRILMGTPI